jgi:hypothetical protein
MVEHLLGMCEALGLILSNTGKKKKNEKRKVKFRARDTAQWWSMS